MSTPTILVSIDDDARRSSVNGVLDKTDFRVRQASQRSPLDALPDVVLVDSADALRRLGAGPLDVAIVSFVPIDEANVRLDDSFTARELILSCRLLSEIVQLRRDNLQNTEERTALTRLATTDAVSGLPNRHAWDRAMEKIASGERFALAIFDVDQFKQANDQQGYQRGDQILRTVGDALAANIRERDLAARIGGDEFGLLLPTVESSFGHAVIERIRGGVVAALTSAELQVSISAGFAAAADQTAGELFQQANAALRLAKEAGGNCTRPSAKGGKGEKRQQGNQDRENG